MSTRGVVAGIVAFLLLFSHRVQAAGESPCQFQNRLDDLATTQRNQSGTFLEQIQSELKVRKDILRTVISCATKEAETLEGSLKSLSINDNEVVRIQNQYIEELDVAIGFYALERSKVEDAGIRGSQDIAQNLLEWRSQTYLPLAGQSRNLILWTKDQELLRIAQHRFDDIRNAVRSLKNEGGDAAKDLLKHAHESLDTAYSENREAKQVLVGGNKNPDESLAHLRTSLESLADTYHSFFDLSKLFAGP